MYDWCNKVCNDSRVLRNNMNYHIRQTLLDGKHTNNKELYDIFKHNPEWKCFGHGQISKNIWKSLNCEWSSFWAALKSYKKDKTKFISEPKYPGYKTRHYKVSYHVGNNNSPCTYKDGVLKFLGSNKIEYKIGNIIDGEIKEISIIPTNTDNFNIIINYIKVENCVNLCEDRIISMDMGVDNILAVTNNYGNSPFLVKGRHIKSINQYYNKKLAYLNSKLPQNVRTSKAIKTLTRKRNNKIEAEMHIISNTIKKYVINNNVGTIIVGKNNGWKQNINIGKKNNQKFVGIPYNKLIFQINYKLEGISKLIEHEESYTSKASFLDLDFIPTYKASGDHKQTRFSGRRIKRGLYKSKSGHLINADINASYNIMRKVIPKVFDNGIEGVVVHPLTLNRSGTTSIKAAQISI